nr:putative protein N(5)-glutamine methyltransferase [Nocardioides acrostichi]
MGDPLVASLRAAGCVYAEAEAALLRESAAGDSQRLADLTARRVAGEPLEPLLGWAELDGVRVVVRPGVFVPRARSLLLVRLSVAHLASRTPPAPAPTVVDLCCGSGALGLLLRRALPTARVHAADVDPVATACAAENLPPGRVHTGDLLAALPGELHGVVDLLVVNAPYVPTRHIASMPREARDHEPLHTLDGGADGLDPHRRLLADAPSWLAPGGALAIETSRAQAPVVVETARRNGWHATHHHDRDLDGTAVLAVRRPGE